MEKITGKEIADFILGLNALIIYLALPCWIIGVFLKVLFEIIEDIIPILKECRNKNKSQTLLKGIVIGMRLKDEETEPNNKKIA